MSNRREKGASEEERMAFLADGNEGRQDDGEHLNRADVMELADFAVAGPSSSVIANVDVHTEESTELEESNIPEESNETKESKDEMEKLRNKNSGLQKVSAMQNNKNAKRITGPHCMDIIKDDVNAEESNELEESNIPEETYESEGTNESEESKDVMEKLWDKNSGLLNAIAIHNNKNVIRFAIMYLCVKYYSNARRPNTPLRQEAKLIFTYLLSHHKVLAKNTSIKTVMDKDGSTVLHWAARDGWSEGVTVALKESDDINHKNSVGDTALHLAAKAGNYEIVKQILDHDKNRQWDFSKENEKRESPFSNAICSGNVDIVRLMLQRNNEMRGYLHRNIKGIVPPLAYAAQNKFQDLFFFILKEIINGKIFSGLAENLHNIFIRDHHWELLSKLQSLKNDDITYAMRSYISKYHILHEAATNNRREQIIDLLKFGADLSQRNQDGQTAISLLMYNVTKPTELLTKLLDECIKINKNINHEDCVITISYSLLKPVNKKPMRPEYAEYDEDSDLLNKKENDMKVLEALIETGDAYDQRSLLTHPVVESFLYLKWKKCAKYIYFLISVYVLFLISLNTYIGTIYYHTDHKIKEQDILCVFNPIFWRVSAIITLCLSSLVDILFWISSKKKWYRNKTIGVKLLLTVGGITMISITMDAADNDIIRGVAVLSVSLSWIYLMVCLSWTPTLGYYMQMYGKVSTNVIKVMLTFSFPLVGFAICFMILLRSKEPFDGPIAAFLKTMVMMSSEFEYENLVKNTMTDSPNDAKNSTLDSLNAKPVTSVFMLRIFFLLFLICVAIVLMNLMLGVAVSDFQELSHDGKQRRLMKQVECICVLQKRFHSLTVEFPLVHIEPDSTIFGREMKEIIFNKAQKLIETKEKKADDVDMKAKIDAITKKQLDLEKDLSEIRKSVNTILEQVALKVKDVNEKTIDKAVDRILEAIANDRRDDRLNLGQQK